MTRHIPFLTFVLGLALLAGCSPARTGVVGNTLTTNTKPPISITVNTPLRLMASGNLAIPIANDKELVSSATTSFDYAVFGQGNASGPVVRHVHAILAKLEDSPSWRFQPDRAGQPHDSSLDGGRGTDGYVWISRLFLAPSRGDWFSELWTSNGRTVPKVWLVKRWIALLDDITKAVVEYREACANCPPEDASILSPLDADSIARLNDFNNRANAAFTAAARNTPLTDTAPVQTMLHRPEKLPDADKLIGQALANRIDSSPN